MQVMSDERRCNDPYTRGYADASDNAYSRGYADGMADAALRYCPISAAVGGGRAAPSRYDVVLAEFIRRGMPVSEIVCGEATPHAWYLGLRNAIERAGEAAVDVVAVERNGDGRHVYLAHSAALAGAAGAGALAGVTIAEAAGIAGVNERRRVGRAEYRAAVERFIADGYRCAEVSFDRSEPEAWRAGLALAVRSSRAAHGNVEVRLRKRHVYLVRTDLPEDARPSGFGVDPRPGNE